MCSYLKNLWSLSPSGDGLRVTSVALPSQILFAPLRLRVLAIKNETQSRKDAKSQSIKPVSVAPPNEKREPREAAASDLRMHYERYGCLPLAPRSGSASCVSYRQWLNLDRRATTIHRIHK